jgi:hypothetical protein
LKLRVAAAANRRHSKPALIFLPVIVQVLGTNLFVLYLQALVADLSIQANDEPVLSFRRLHISPGMI